MRTYIYIHIYIYLDMLYIYHIYVYMYICMMWVLAQGTAINVSYVPWLNLACSAAVHFEKLPNGTLSPTNMETHIVPF